MNTLMMLKLYVLAHGMRVSVRAEQVWREMFGGPMSLREYASTTGICLYIGEDPRTRVFINAPFMDAFMDRINPTEASFTYDDNAGGFAIEWRDQQYLVSVIPVATYHNQLWTDGDNVERPFTDIIVTHTDRGRVSPIDGCASVCTFCDLYKSAYRKKPMAKMVRALALATNDELSPARHILISGGTPRPEDEAWIDKVYATLATHATIPVDVMMQWRPHDPTHPRRLRKMGINALSLNMEVVDRVRALRIVPSKSRQDGGIDGFLRYVDSAVNEFGVGFVQSLIVFGSAIEPVESTLQGVQMLAERGAIPVLSMFRPPEKAPLRNSPPASVDEMQRVLEGAIEICDRSGTGVKVGPRCIACGHNTVVFPDGTDFYVPEGGDLTNRAWNK